MDSPTFQFAPLSFNDLASRIYESTSHRMRPADFSQGCKVDSLLCHYLFEFFGMVFNPIDRPLYPVSITNIFINIKAPEVLTPIDFMEERDAKKWIKMLSHLFQFYDTIMSAREYAISVYSNLKDKASFSTALQRKLEVLESNNKTEEAKRSEYRKKISVLNTQFSAISTTKRQVLDAVASEKQRLAALTDSEKNNTAKTAALREKLEELLISRETLNLRVFDNPDVLPEKVDQLQQKLIDIEMEMQVLASKAFQVNQSITEFRRLHSVIQEKMVAVCSDCCSLLEEITQTRTELEQVDKDLAEHLAVLADFSKKIPVETEKLRLVEHDIVKKKLAITNQTTNENRIKKEKNALLDKHCAAVKSLMTSIETAEALLNTTKALFEEESANKQGNEEWELTEEIKDRLHRLYQSYAQSQRKWSLDCGT